VLRISKHDHSPSILSCFHKSRSDALHAFVMQIFCVEVKTDELLLAVSEQYNSMHTNEVII